MNASLRSQADLITAIQTGITPKWAFFWGHTPSKDGCITKSCFSQWWECHPFIIDSVVYPTAEHYMMAEKAALFGDPTTRALILSAPTPGAAKALGRQVRGFNEETWLAHRYAIVVRANLAKFAQNPALGAFLRNTGTRVLVEASPVDTVWGIGLAQDDAKVNDPNQWRGLNLLGFALMQVRDGA